MTTALNSNHTQYSFLEPFIECHYTLYALLMLALKCWIHIWIYLKLYDAWNPRRIVSKSFENCTNTLLSDL